MHTYLFRTMPFLILFSLLTINPCQAQIRTSDSLGCAPLLVDFSILQDTFTGVVWDFRDGATSNKNKASHIFVQPGTYQVGLKNYGQLVAVTTISVYPKPVLDITSDITQGCAPLTVGFQDKTVLPPGIQATGYLWDFGDGDGTSEKNPSHIYQSVDVFSVTLNMTTNVENCNLTKTFDKYISISDKLNVNFIIDSIRPLCVLPAHIHLKNMSVQESSYSYLWDFGNGTTSAVFQPAPVKVDKDSTYSISLLVNNNKGCIARLTRKAEVYFTPTIRIQAEDTICALSPLKINTQSNVSLYKWDFGKEALPAASSSANPSVTYSKNGTYPISLTYTSKSGCKKDTSFYVTVKQKNAGFTFLPATICQLPDTIRCSAERRDYNSYWWNGILGGPDFDLPIPSVPRDTFYYNKPDSVKVHLNIKSVDGCISDSTLYFEYALPNAQFTISGHEGIVPWNVSIKDISESVYPVVTWIVNWGDGTTSTYDSLTIKTANHTYLTEGKYHINMHIINEKGCEDRHFGAWVHAHADISLSGLPDIVFSCNQKSKVCNGTCRPGTMCYRQEFSVGLSFIPPGLDAVHFNMGPSVGNCDQQFSLLNTPMQNEPGVYPLSASLENGGEFYEILGPTVEVLGPMAKIDYQVHCDDSYRVTFTNKSIDYSNIIWQIDSTERTDETFTYQFPGRGDYIVRLVASSDVNPCTPDTTEVLIRLRDVRAHIETPREWCFNEKSELIATASQDEIVGCKMGYLWSFPTASKPNIITDRDTVTTAMPPGKHLIVLTVRDVNGCIDRDTAEVTSYYIKARFTSTSQQFCSPLQVTFLDSTIADAAIRQYEWSLSPEHNNKQLDYTFASIHSSSVEVVLNVTDEKGCKSSFSRTFTTYKPQTTLTFLPVLCEGMQATFAATDFTENRSRLLYKWTIDGKTASADNRFVMSGLSSGDHTGYLEIMEESTRCTNSYDFQFYVSKKPDAIIADLGDSVFCYPKTVQFFGDRSVVDPRDKVTYYWTYSNGRASTKTNPVETFGKGEYTVRLTVRSKYQCGDMDQKTIRLIGPEGGLTTDKTKICKGDTIHFSLAQAKEVEQFFWDFGQGEVNSNLSPVPYTYSFYPPSGSTFASLVLYGNEKSCRVIKTVPIRFYKVNASFIPDTVCGNTMQIRNTSLGAESAMWRWENRSSQSRDSVLSVSVSAPGTYPMSLSIKGREGGCKDTFSANLVFNPYPATKLPDAVAACEGDTIRLPYDPAYTYTYSPFWPDTIEENASVFIARTSETLQIKATSAEGCTKDNRVAIKSRAITQARILRTIYICSDYSPQGLYVDTSGLASIIWSVPGQSAGDILSCTDCGRPSLLKPYSGALYAHVTDKATCRETEYVFTVHTTDVSVPNVFSPNEDMTNDVFRPVTADPAIRDAIRLDDLKIYNRWGKEIHNGAAPWDGNSNGIAVPAGVYFFSMTSTVGNVCTATHKGDVTLIR